MSVFEEPNLLIDECQIDIGWQGDYDEGLSSEILAFWCTYPNIGLKSFNLANRTFLDYCNNMIRKFQMPLYNGTWIGKNHIQLLFESRDEDESYRVSCVIDIYKRK